jgi:fused signal recognition particle receptor
MKWFSKLKDGLKKTSSTFTDNLTKVFTHKKINAETLEDLEDILLQADLGVTATTKILKELQSEKVKKDATVSDIQKQLAKTLSDIMIPAEGKLNVESSKKPYVILMIGVNGSGKTTTTAKLATQLKEGGLNVRLAACDTFRAAAVEQLETWANRINIPISKGHLNSDPASLAFTAYEAAQKNKEDVLIIDTAGRLHTNHNLMAELEKIIRVLKKLNPDLPHDTLMVLDATIGQNARTQLEIFNKSAPITGLVMTKLDGTARGGILVSLFEKTQIPIYYVGVGEAKEDLHPFNGEDYARGLSGL